MTEDKTFRSISVSNSDYQEYDDMRLEFAKEHNIPVNKVSMAMVINVGMKFYKQRRKMVEATK